MSEQSLVVKFGSDLVTNEQGVMKDALDEYANGLSAERRKLIVVTSGAVAMGRQLWHERNAEAEVDLRVLATLGSAGITAAWQEAFAKQEILAGQLLVTHHEIDVGEEGYAFVDTLKAEGAAGVVPVVNENDALSNTELMKLATGGDNDGLAACIAAAISAEELRIFTKKGGIVDDDDTLIKQVDENNYEEVAVMLDRRAIRRNSNGRGGMASKLAAAWRAADTCSRVIIAAPNKAMNGEKPTVVTKNGKI